MSHLFQKNKKQKSHNNNTLEQPGKTKYRTGKDLYRWSRGKSRSFLLTLNFLYIDKWARFSRDQR